MIILLLLILAVVCGFIFANMALYVAGAALGLRLVIILTVIKRRRQQ